MRHVKVAVIGTGPAGYTAALYSARAQMAPIVFAGLEFGGQLMYTTDVENFPGFENGVRGPDLMMTMSKQAQRFGAEMEYSFVTAVDFSQRPFKLWTQSPTVGFDVYKKSSDQELAAAIAEVRAQEPTFTADSIILSTGATSIMLNVPGEQEFFAKGVSTCAVCDAAFYGEKETFVIGGGDSAMEDALALTKFATSVTLVHRRDSFKASKIMQDRVLNHPKIKVLWNSEVVEVIGKDTVTSLKIKTTNPATKQENIAEYPAQGMFVAIGHRPMTKVFSKEITLDPHGYIVTRQSATKWGVEAAQKAVTEDGLLEYPTMTSVEGVFAAGDVVDVRYKQAISSAGQGCMASLDAERWLERQGL